MSNIIYADFVAKKRLKPLSSPVTTLSNEICTEAAEVLKEYLGAVLELHDTSITNTIILTEIDGLVTTCYLSEFIDDDYVKSILERSLAKMIVTQGVTE